MLTTESTISRLESLPSEPSGHRSASRRQLAYILCHVYGVDPAEFGLSPDDLPPGIDLKPLDLAATTDRYMPISYPPLQLAA